MFTDQNMLDSTPDQLAALNEELRARLAPIDPNDYDARSEAEAAFRLEVSQRPHPTGEVVLMHGSPAELEPEAEHPDAAKASHDAHAHLSTIHPESEHETTKP